jgi:hypothetical protein
MTQGTSSKRLGVYVLANDSVLAWFSAFVNSFRKYNPTLELCLIPFDDRHEQCKTIIESANGTVLSDAAAFDELERIGAMLEGGRTTTGPKWFRRYAAFTGPFDNFAYLDGRTVVLADVSGFAAAASTFDVPLVHCDVAINQVYEDGPTRLGFCRQGKGHGFLSGMWSSKRSLFKLDDMRKAADELLMLRDQMNPRNTDQFFINYLCDSRGMQTCHIADLDSRLCHSAWARQHRHIFEDSNGVWRVWDFGGLQHRKQLFLLHWAGLRLHPAMPHFAIHRKFRTPQAGVMQRGGELLAMMTGQATMALRANRFINETYHAWLDSNNGKVIMPESK